jgi:hypothetical protein
LARRLKEAEGADFDDYIPVDRWITSEQVQDQIQQDEQEVQIQAKIQVQEPNTGLERQDNRPQRRRYLSGTDTCTERRYPVRKRQLTVKVVAAAPLTSNH